MSFSVAGGISFIETFAIIQRPEFRMLRQLEASSGKEVYVALVVFMNTFDETRDDYPVVVVVLLLLL